MSLLYASARGHMICVKLLLQHGADPLQTNEVSDIYFLSIYRGVITDICINRCFFDTTGGIECARVCEDWQDQECD